ncbi:MAG: hypothetical protein HYR96_03645 [Deltaproteobacteria bacterium]|nr:hypothetical protein [Deltaproteobacteria bacterium]
MKRSLAVILTVLAGVSMAKPLSFLDSLQLTPSLKESNAAIVGCTDFSGKWSGNCSGQGQSAKEEFTITQSGCEMIEIASGKGKHTLPVGGVFSVGGAMPGTPAATSFGGSITSNWNKELTVLNFYVHGGMKKLSHKLRICLETDSSEGRVCARPFFHRSQKRHRCPTNRRRKGSPQAPLSTSTMARELNALTLGEVACYALVTENAYSGLGGGRIVRLRRNRAQREILR